MTELDHIVQLLLIGECLFRWLEGSSSISSLGGDAVSWLSLSRKPTTSSISAAPLSASFLLWPWWCFSPSSPKTCSWNVGWILWLLLKVGFPRIPANVDVRDASSDFIVQIPLTWSFPSQNHRGILMRGVTIRKHSCSFERRWLKHGLDWTIWTAHMQYFSTDHGSCFSQEKLPFHRPSDSMSLLNVHLITDKAWTWK